MFGAKLDALKTTTCALLLDQLTALNTVTTNLTKGLSNTLGELGKLGGILKLNNNNNNINKKPTNVANNSKPKNTVNSLRLL